MKNYYFILGHPFTKKSVFITVTLILIMVAVIVSGSYFAITDKQEPTQASAPVDPAPKAEDPLLSVDPNSLVDIVTMHIQITGFDQLRTFTMRGKPLHDSEQRTVSVKGLHPNFYKFTVNYLTTNNSVEFGYNGEEKWMESSWSNRTFPNEETDKSVILILSSVPHLAWTYNSAKSSLEAVGNLLTLKPEQIHKGRNCYVIHSRKILPFEMDHYIDTETFHEVYRTATLQKADGSTIEIGVEYDQEKIDKSSQFSLFHEVYENGELIDELVYESPRKNITLMSALFAPPSEYGR